MELLDKIKNVKQVSHKISNLTDAARNNVLESLASSLRDNITAIITANKIDLDNMKEKDAVYDRLLLDENRILGIARDVEEVTKFASPIGKVLEKKMAPNGLVITKVSVPIGVVAVVYESRPNVTVDVFSLCFKSGNSCILKGGKEAYHTNNVLVSLIQSTLERQGVDKNAVMLLSSNRDDVHTLLQAEDLVDACIPRGSNSLIDFVRKNSTIPVIETGSGVVHIYFDLYGEVLKGRNIIDNAKTRRVSVCNALDCLLVHRERLKDLYDIVEPLQRSHVELFVDHEAFDVLQGQYPSHLIFHASGQDYGREFLSHKMAIRTVDSVSSAVAHISKYTSGHSECIITENEAIAECFTTDIDSAVIYVNASTAFTDGGEFGMGAEIGISTQKLHARGPMGLEALTSYKWIVYGNGQIR
ncbi:glutamate-5-semialdehyde dehydrogenase [Rickettsiales endosymbiont of Peranema trichophorum]|uniref:glutamate-5-semialdehyde dehydrogenase n=1 Tax=Rickettsiales endosymbiont of Peranema trichophorum TaxID=2486577 RepID=UPI0010238367|nr:glutamate-5-semialdehyde dehydrogenase [Rickettsiales endosymbiont of Peranema trichophorum]RZI47778.1 glutamate-5-semialdehyde dehydrogenase [Rickettsiales endosymbiont of Peranema trichophorum]